jgi:hypothetical protein
MCGRPDAPVARGGKAAGSGSRSTRFATRTIPPWRRASLRPAPPRRAEAHCGSRTCRSSAALPRRTGTRPASWWSRRPRAGDQSTRSGWPPAVQSRCPPARRHSSRQWCTPPQQRPSGGRRAAGPGATGHPETDTARPPGARLHPLDARRRPWKPESWRRRAVLESRRHAHG